jgi:dTDP-glucose 4,6-dehydratase
MRLLITGGAGFIGSNYARHALLRWPDCRVTVLDKLTYAGNRANIADLEESGRLDFVHGDICDEVLVGKLVADHDVIINFAAESHVDRSIDDSAAFVRTDVEGTRCLLEAARVNGVERHIQISTDEVYGDIPAPERSTIDSPLMPRSPYAASKAAGDLMVRSYVTTHGVDARITRCSNNYGPYQYPEKLISLFTTNAIDGRLLPVYGDGMQERDWIYVEDHCAAISVVLEKGIAGGIYNIGTEVETRNLDIVTEILRITGLGRDMIRHVDDRPGHDRRYAIDTSSTRALGWAPRMDLSKGLESTIRWFMDHQDWWRPLRDKSFEAYYDRQYGDRLKAGSPG